MISKTQRLQIDAMRLASFNEFDGNAVADSLLENQVLWRAFILDREAYTAEYVRRRMVEERLQEGQLPVAPIDLIRLRDLEAGYWNVDVLFILPVDGREDQLEALARTWSADEIDWYSGQDAGARVLRVWFD